MFPTLILSSFVGVSSLPEEVVDRLVSTRTVVVQRQVQLSVVFYKGDPLGSKEAGTVDILSRPTLLLTHKQTGFFQVGDPKGAGLTLRATPQLRLDGKIRMTCETAIATPKVHSGIRLASGSFVEGVSEETAKTAVVLTPGKSMKVRVSARSATDQTWLELTATVVDDPTVTTRPGKETMGWSMTDTATVDLNVRPVALPTVFPTPAPLVPPPPAAPPAPRSVNSK